MFPLVGYQATSSATHSGWIGGGGIEYAFTNNLSAKVEGLYYDMGSETIAFTSPLTHFSQTSNYAYKGALVRLGANLNSGPEPRFSRKTRRAGSAGAFFFSAVARPLRIGTARPGACQSDSPLA